MSSKSAPDRPRAAGWSLALRLTLWYAASAFLLLLLATGYLYWSLVEGLLAEDDEYLLDRLAALRRVLADDDALRQEVRSAESARVTEPIRVRVLDARSGRVRAETAGMDALPAEVFPPAGPAEQLRDRRADGRYYRLLAWSGDGQVIQAAMDRTGDDELLAGYRLRIGYVLGLSLVGCAAGGYAIARRGMRPVEDVTATAGRIRPGHLGERLSTEGIPAEVRRLAETFNRMLDRLEDAFTRLSQFSADLAHELRTPVNALRGEAEVALGRSRTAAEYREALTACLEESVRLGRLIDNLLFLARTEDPKTELHAEPVDVGRELEALRGFFEPAAAEAGVTLAVEAQAGLVVAADRTLFQRAVGNLVSNALAHTPAGGTVTVRAVRDGDGVCVEVTDTGEGIAAEHLPFVFDRFYRADRARSSAHGRVGLGLAIVKGIAELHGGTVTAASRVGHGTTVSLRLPGKMTKS